jgi:uncharacterized protein (DUF433 family)
MDRAEVREKLATDPTLAELIVCNPGLLSGKPAIFGTRLSVELVLEGLAAGRTAEQLLAHYPTLYPQGIVAAVAYAERLPLDDPLARLLAEYRALRGR